MQSFQLGKQERKAAQRIFSNTKKEFFFSFFFCPGGRKGQVHQTTSITPDQVKLANLGSKIMKYKDHARRWSQSFPWVGMGCTYEDSSKQSSLVHVLLHVGLGTWTKRCDLENTQK